VGVSSDQNPMHRRTMEDEHLILDNFGGDKSCGYFAVYDGHGGRDVVEFVAKKLHVNVLKEMNTCYEVNPDVKNPQHPTVAKALQQAFIKTDEQIKEEGINKSGSTGVVAVVRKKGDQRWLYVAGIGDARAVLNREGKAARLSYDHKATDEGEAKRIKEDGGWVVQGKVAGILAVTRSFGDLELKQWVISEPFITETELKRTDTQLIIACDGLWDVCEDQSAVELITGLDSAQEKSDKLLSYALTNKTKDNVSIIVVDL